MSWREISLVPKLQLGNSVPEAPASRLGLERVFNPFRNVRDISRRIETLRTGLQTPSRSDEEAAELAVQIARNFEELGI